MLAQTTLPPALQRIATTPVLASERPAGFPHVKITRLDADRRIHTLGTVRIDFSNSHVSESASYALMRTHAGALRLARTEATVKTGGLFHTRAVAVGRFAVGVAAATKAEAKALLALALSHLRRSER
ncbi:MAG TPA: hypothetical protein VJ814_07095 [Gaiellaceae bacterium]|nr:hypothetical protein [Gaiellaceae bacterium]